MSHYSLRSAIYAWVAISIAFVSSSDLNAAPMGIPAEAKAWKEVSSEGVQAFVHRRKVWLVLSSKVIGSGKVVIPRLCAPIRSIRWKGPKTSEVKFVPEPKEWVFSWKKIDGQMAVIEVDFDAKPVLPSNSTPAKPAGDGSVMLHAYQASTFGEKVRFEPQWYKNTVGYWVIPGDYVTWKLTIDQPGRYTIAVLQGCGKGHGGSDANITLRQGDNVRAELPFKTIDTGHFQNFRWNHLGSIEVSAKGEYELRIAPKKIAKVALFDVRMIHLVRQAK